MEKKGRRMQKSRIGKLDPLNDAGKPLDRKALQTK
jgi:hypothetical protein